MRGIWTIVIAGLIAGALSAAISTALVWRGARGAGSPAVPKDELSPPELPEQPGRRVNSPAALDGLLRDRSVSARVIIPKDVVWKMERCDRPPDEIANPLCTPLLETPLYSGVQLVGERGDLGSRPLL